MPNPFLPLVLCLMVGIWCGRSSGCPSLFWAVLTVSCLAAGWLFYGKRKDRFAAVCLLLAAFSLGALRSVEVHSAYRHHPLRTLRLPGYADFEGRLSCSPSREAGGSRLTLDLENILSQKRNLRVRGRVRVSVLAAAPEEAGALRALRPGDRVRISARLSRSEGYRNFDAPPLERLLEQQGLHRTAFAKSALLVTRTSAGSSYDPRRWAASLRQGFLDKIEEHFREAGGKMSESGAALEAILLGERGSLDDALTRSLQDSGLYHLIAISGAHIAVFSYLLYSLLRLGRCPRRTASLALIFFLVFYALVVEGRASVLRAVMMTVLFLLGKLLWKDVPLLNTVSLSAFVLLLWNPTGLWDAGFQLSYVATLSLILLAPRLQKRLPRLPLRLSGLFSVSLAAHLAVAPILVSAFHRVTFAGIFLNLAAVPLMAVIMTVGYIFLALAFVHPFLGQIIGAVLEMLVRFFLFLSRLTSEVPFLCYRLPSPPAPVTILYALLLLALLLPPRFKGQTSLLLTLFLGAFVVLSVYPFPARRCPGLRLTFLDVGQGDSILVEFPGRKKMLVDAGGAPSGDFDVGESVVSPALWRAGMKKVDILVSTHAHPDHIGGMAAVARSFRVGEVWEATSPATDPWQLRFRRSLPPSVPLRRPAAGHIRNISGVSVETLHAPEDAPRLEVVDNESSLVLRLTYGRVSFILTGDIGRETEARLLQEGSPLASAVLKAAHHGSDTSTSREFLERVRPSLAVVSVGEGNMYGLPSPRVLDRLRRAGVRIYRTDRDGAVEITTDGRTMKVRTSPWN